VVIPVAEVAKWLKISGGIMPFIIYNMGKDASMLENQTWISELAFVDILNLYK